MKRAARVRVGLAVGVLAALAALAPVSGAAAAGRPVIRHFAITGKAPSEEGGVAVVKIQVRGAASCTIIGPSAVIGGEWSGPCPARGRTHKIWLPANRGERAATYRLTLLAHGAGGTTRRRLTVVVPGERKLQPGLWRVTLTLLGTPHSEVFIASVFANGTWTTDEGKATGTWTYKHREMRLIYGTVFDLKAFGPHRGPLVDASEPFESGGKLEGYVSVGMELVSAF